MKSVEQWYDSATSANSLIPYEGWIKDRTPEQWDVWRQTMMDQRLRSGRQYFRPADPGDRSTLRQFGVPEEIVNFVSKLEALRLADACREDDYRYAAYQRKLEDEAKSGSASPRIPYWKTRNGARS